MENNNFRHWCVYWHFISTTPWITSLLSLSLVSSNVHIRKLRAIRVQCFLAISFKMPYELQANLSSGEWLSIQHDYQCAKVLGYCKWWYLCVFTFCRIINYLVRKRGSSRKESPPPPLWQNNDWQNTHQSNVILSRVYVCLLNFIVLESIKIWVYDTRSNVVLSQPATCVTSRLRNDHTPPQRCFILWAGGVWWSAYHSKSMYFAYCLRFGLASVCFLFVNT